MRIGIRCACATIGIAVAGAASAQTPADTKGWPNSAMLKVQPGYTAPKMISCTPEISYELDERRLKGEATLVVCVDQNGAAVRADLVKSSGSPRQDASALSVMRSCTWSPAAWDGRPLSVCGRQITFRFELPAR